MTVIRVAVSVSYRTPPRSCFFFLKKRGGTRERRVIKFARELVDVEGMGVLIALGLAVLVAAAVLVRRSTKVLPLATVLAAGAATLWLAWAENEYRGLTSCPFDDQNRGHPALVGLALSFGSAALVVSTRWKQDSRGRAAALGLSTGVLAGVGILVVAFMFGAGLHCTD